MGTVGVGLKKWDSADWIEFRQGRNDFGLSYSAVIKFSSQKSLPANICLVKQLRSQKKKNEIERESKKGKAVYENIW